MLTFHPYTFRGFIVLAALLVATATVAEALSGGRTLDGAPGCSFCGDGITTIRNGEFEVGGSGVKCSRGRTDADIKPKNCLTLQGEAFEPCGCTGTNPSSPPPPPPPPQSVTTASSQTGTSNVKGALANYKGDKGAIDKGAIASNYKGDNDLPHCSICGDGKMTIPDGKLEIYGNSATCAFLEAKPTGTQKNICDLVQNMAAKPCGCESTSNATTKGSSNAKSKPSSSTSSVGQTSTSSNAKPKPSSSTSSVGKTSTSSNARSNPSSSTSSVGNTSTSHYGISHPSSSTSTSSNARSNPSSSTSSVGTTSISSKEAIPEAADSEHNNYLIAFLIISVCSVFTIFIYNECCEKKQSSEDKAIMDEDELAVQDMNKSSYSDVEDYKNESSFKDEV